MSLARSSLLFGMGTLVSRISGLFRDMVVTHLLGAGVLHDAFVVAQRIPNLLRDMLAEGALGSSFTKVYTALKEQDTYAAEKLLFQTLYLLFFVLMALVSVGMYFSSFVVKLMSLGAAQPPSYEATADQLTLILLPTLSMTVLGAIAMGALYQKGRFFFNAIIPVVANVGVVVGGIFLGSWLERIFPAWANRVGDATLLGLAVGTILGFFLQMVSALWCVRSQLFAFGREYWRQAPWSADIIKVLKLLGPAAIATSAAPINSIVNTNFATAVGPGAVTWLTYAFRILQLPIGVFGVAVGVYALPALTRAVVQANKGVDDRVSQQLQEATLFVTWLLVPCMIFSLCYSHDIIELLFRHGRFSPADVSATSKALFGYSFCMVAYGVIKVMTSFYYAIDKTSFAMKVSLGGIAVNLLGNWALVGRLGHVGLAVTSSMTLIINASILMWGTRRVGVTWHRESLVRHLKHLFLGLVIFLFLLPGVEKLSRMGGFYLRDQFIYPVLQSHDLESSALFGFAEKIICMINLLAGGIILLLIFIPLGLRLYKRTGKVI